MLSSELIIPTLQRVEDVLGWELGQIVENSQLPWYQIPEAEQKVAQAKHSLSQVLPLVREMMMPFVQEQAALNAAQEAVLQASHKASMQEVGRGMSYLLNR